MKANLSRMLRSGVAMLLAFCMVAGFVPTMAFATEADKINYVSIGDSMANGYCFEGYEQGNGSNINFFEGTGVYGVGAYPDQFADYLEENGANVEHTKLAVSALRAEDLYFLLGGREEPQDGWENQVNGYTEVSDDAKLAEFYQNAVTEADIITLGVGNASFGAYMLHRVTDALGIFGASLDEDEKVDLNDALIDLNEEQKALVLEAYDMLEAELMKKIPAELAERYNVQQICDILAYTAAGFILNYKGSVEQIVKLNPDVEVILVGLMNTTYGMTVTAEGMAPIYIGDIMDELFSMLNAYIAGLPAVMQAAGEWEEATFYYAEQPNPLFISQEFAALKEAGWTNIQDDRLSGDIVRARNITAYNDSLRGMIAAAFSAMYGFQMNLPEITLADVQAYEANNPTWAYSGQGYGFTGNGNDNKNLSIAIYLGIEDAVAESCDTMEIPLSGLMKIAGDLSSVFAGLDVKANEAGSTPEDVHEGLAGYLTSTDELKGMCKIYALFKVGNGMSVHPTPVGHDNIAASVINAYKNNHTAKDETIQNVNIALKDLYNLVQTYGPEVAAQVWQQWEEYGYVDAVETSIDELKTMLEERYTYYTETALPAITASVENLSAQKDVLTAELADLKAELEAKKAELAEVISNTEIGDIYVPNINIDVDLGNNEQTQVPENDCTVDGEDIKTELEAAVKDLEHAIAVIEALLADVEADIADMIALAEQIAAAVAELEKTMTSLAEAAEDVEAAVNAVIDVIKNSDGVVEATVKSFAAARAAAEAAVETMTLAMDTAEDVMADVDTMIQKITADAEALYNKFMNDLPGCIDAIPDEAKMLIAGSVYAVQQAYEANKEEIEAALEVELKKLADEYAVSEEEIKAEQKKLAEDYSISEEAVKAELAAIEAKITAEVNAKYAEIEAEYNAQIEAAKAEAAAKLAELEAELKGYQEELANAAEDAKAGIQAQIDRVNADIATVNADLEHAVAHLENAAQEGYEQIVAEVTKVYEETVAALNEKLAELKAAYDEAVAAIEQKLAELKAAYDKAVEELITAADKAIAELTEALNKTLEELGKIGEALADEINGILIAIRKELTDTQKAIEEILKGNLAAIEDLKDALVEMGGEAIVDAVEALNDAVMALIEKATTADLVIDDDFKYVAIGDGSAAPESYVEKVTAALNAEAAANGVDEIEMVNYAKVGNTVTAERANLSNVTDADLITVGFSNVEFMSKAIANMSTGAELDWAAAVGEENVQYVDQLLAEVAEKITEAGIEGDYAIMANNAIEAYAYAAVLYATELPELVNEIHAVNPDAVIIIVGMYNPMDGVIINLGENATLDIGEYVDYLVKGVGVHGVAYSILTGNSIYVDAPAVQTVNTDTELGILDLLTLMQTGCASLYPSAVGDDYIAAEIADALNITYVKSEVEVLLGDVNGDGVVDAKDVTRLRKYMADPDTTEINFKNADVNLDGVVDAKDMTRMRKHFADGVAFG